LNRIKKASFVIQILMWISYHRFYEFLAFLFWLAMHIAETRSI